MPVALPWGSSTGELRTVRLYLHTPDGMALMRPRFNELWWRALRATGIPVTRQNGMHVLRHTYASVLLDAGESIRRWPPTLAMPTPGSR